MNKAMLLTVAMVAGIGTASAQNVTVDVPSGYKVVVVPTSVTVPQAIVVTTPAPQAVYVAPPAPVYHQRARHVASVAEGMVIEHQYDDHH
ncbi:MAG: hypothetical protein RR068_07325 [Hafnia sp.]